MTPGILNQLPVILGSLFALGCLIAAFANLRRKRLIDDLPTSKTQGVFIGLAEVKGTAESEAPLTSFLAGVRCVHYSWQIEEHWSRTVHETYTDARGHTQTRTRTESGWKRVASGGESAPFYLQDDTGVIRIVPEGATVHGTATVNEACTRESALYFGKGPAQEIANSDHRRRFHETVLPLHAMLYVIGQARERQDVVAAEIAQDKNAPMFLISTRTEKQVSTSYGRWFYFWLALGLAVSAGGAAVYSLLRQPALGAPGPLYIVAAGGFLIALGLGWVWTVYNSLINLHHRVEQSWSQVDVQLKRRHDLIPNLVQIVEGYRVYEREVQELLATLRGQGQVRPSAAADLKAFAPVLRVTVERYPELKANESFLKLQQALVETEQRLALARGYFNETATFYNTRLAIVPDRFVAAMARLHPRLLMGAGDLERAPIQVQLVS